MIAARFELGPIEADVDAAVAELASANAVERLWAKDHTLFDPAPDEIADRMGWLDSPAQSRREVDSLVEFAAEVAATSDHVVVMGMGGSSLFPEVVAATFGSGDGYPQLHVLDTTSPAAVARLLSDLPPARTFHVASSKSGSTVETRSHLELMWDRSRDPSRFAVITDPGSALGIYARGLGFRRVFENNPDIGGRYSALSLFGLVPAALADVDVDAVLDAADDQVAALLPGEHDADDNVGLRLAAVLGAAARAGRDKLTILVDDRIGAFGAWLEQLVAESTGKHGTGIVPVVDEPLDVSLAGGSDRLFVAIGDVGGLDRVRAAGHPLVSLGLEEPTDLGAQVLLWEFAVALAGRVLAVNPFDQPDVEAAKVAARRLLDAHSVPDVTESPLSSALEAVQPGDYLALCAFVDPGGEVASQLATVRAALGARLGVATTLGFGPRFLHSTGQLHKGGPGTVVVVQVLDVGSLDVAIPGQPHTFGGLLAAQAAGDLTALREAGKRAFRVGVGELLGAR